MAAQGDGYFKKRVVNEERKKTLDKALDQLKDKIRELSSGYLPVVIASMYADKLKIQVQKENADRASAYMVSALADKRDELLKFIASDTLLESIELPSRKADFLKKSLFEKIGELFDNGEKPCDVKEIFGFSEKQTVEILSALESAQSSLPDQINKFTDKYEELYRELQDVVAQLDKTPDEDFIRPMYETLQELEKERGELFGQKEELTAQIDSHRLRIAELDRNIESINKKIIANEKATEKLEKVTKVQNVLEKYYKELTCRKISLLQEEFSKAFNLLHRKEDMISRVEIDSDTCVVTIFDSNGGKVKRSTLSSGELEIYAISMLWALAKTSGQQLPFIIDTPLARLDSKHRDNLIQHFLPVASHQVMVFSTNTEVDQKYFELLRPHISQSYNLDYDEKAQRTVVKEGYFWT
jgi:DNA sulfur modification protein DndD